MADLGEHIVVIARALNGSDDMALARYEDQAYTVADALDEAGLLATAPAPRTLYDNDVMRAAKGLIRGGYLQPDLQARIDLALELCEANTVDGLVAVNAEGLRAVLTGEVSRG